MTIWEILKLIWVFKMDVNNPRSINTIKEEIADLDSLIKDTQLFIEEYPDDSALEFSLKDLQNQRNLLYQELENAHELICLLYTSPSPRD